MAEKFLSEIFFTAVQALMYSRRSENRICQLIASRRLAHAFGRFSGALAGRIGKPIMRKTERHEPFFLLYGKK
jgi:hypothetical protein